MNRIEGTTQRGNLKIHLHTQILCEIIWIFRSSKTAILAILEALDFDY